MTTITKHIEKQINNYMRDIWIQKVHDQIVNKPPNFDYIVDLYKEIKKRILDITFNKNKKKEIDEKLDIVIFRQMIENDTFNIFDFINIIDYTFYICLSLGSPQRDHHVKSLKQEVLNSINNIGVYYAIAVYFHNINQCIDFIYQDLENLKSS